MTNPSSYTGGHQQSKAAPELSVIIPVYAAEPESVDFLRNALDRLKASRFPDFEVLVADDGSRLGDQVRAVAQEAGAELVRLDERRGPAAARNAAARNARGDVLVFMDADTSVHPDTLERFARRLCEDPDLDAVMGSYDQRPSAPGVVSRFRNLLHSFVHHRASPRATTFWAGCGAVRKERFVSLGGFDESFPRPSIEDVEFGLRLTSAGGSIQLDREIQVTHHKEWTLSSMVGTDLFSRAIPWALLLHKHPMPLDLNFKAGDRISSALGVVALMATVIALLHGGLWWFAPFLSLAVIGLLNWPLFRFLARATSWRQAILSFPLLLIYLATCVSGLIAGLALAEHRQDRWLWPAAGMIGLVLLTLQILGGAYTAEFMGHADEAAQFVSGLMVYDYLATLPRENAIDWAGQYYLHYPKVAIGHWPPGYPAMEGLWWLMLGPSRLTAMLLQWLIGVVALTVLYRLCRSVLSLPITALVIALTIATPVFQESLQQTMADLCCLLWSVLLMQAAVCLVERQDRKAAFAVLVWLLAAAFTKGTAVCLAPVPLVALLASGRPIRIPRRVLVAGAGCLVIAGAWYFSIGGVRAWGGMSFDVPWPGRVDRAPGGLGLPGPRGFGPAAATARVGGGKRHRLRAGGFLCGESDARGSPLDYCSSGDSRPGRIGCQPLPETMGGGMPAAAGLNAFPVLPVPPDAVRVRGFIAATGSAVEDAGVVGRLGRRSMDRSFQPGRAAPRQLHRAGHQGVG